MNETGISALSNLYTTENVIRLKVIGRILVGLIVSRRTLKMKGKNLAEIEKRRA